MKEVGIEAYFKDINRIPLLTAQEEKDLSRKVRVGDQKAREKMIKANLRLVVSIAINLIGALGAQPRHIILGFLFSSALISMWVSNTATTLMLNCTAASKALVLVGAAS